METINIAIAEALGVDVSRYISLMKQDPAIQKMENLFYEEFPNAVPITSLPYGWSFSYKHHLLGEAILIDLEDVYGQVVGTYVAKAVSVQSTTQVSKLKRVIVLIGKGLMSLYSEGTLPGIDTYYLSIERS